MRKATARAALAAHRNPLPGQCRLIPLFKQVADSMEFRSAGQHSASHLQNSNNSWFEIHAPCGLAQK